MAGLSVRTGDPDHPYWSVQETLDYYGETNHFGDAICPPEYYMLPHVAIVPRGAGTPPWCSCGWTHHGDAILADHLKDMGEFAG